MYFTSEFRIGFLFLKIYIFWRAQIIYWPTHLIIPFIHEYISDLTTDNIFVKSCACRLETLKIMKKQTYKLESLSNDEEK